MHCAVAADGQCRNPVGCRTLGCSLEHSAQLEAEFQARMAARQTAIPPVVPAAAPAEPLELTKDMLVTPDPSPAPAASARPASKVELVVKAVRGGFAIYSRDARDPGVVADLLGVAHGPAGVAELAAEWAQGSL